MELIFPQKLKKGDTIAIVSPSGGLAGLVPHRLDNAIKFLKSLGLNIKEYPCTRKTSGWESAPAKERAKDLMAAFTDKDVKGIICSIGGCNANKILKYLNYEEIRANPKAFCGYSDASVIHYALFNVSGLSTYYGPALMTQFGEFPRPLEYTVEHFKKAMLENQDIGKIKPSKEWTDEVLDWFEKKDLERPRRLKCNPGYEWLREGTAKGQIIGGCISSIIHLIGTDYWPNHSGKILFLENPEGEDFTAGEPLSNVDALLADLDNAGIFREIRGLVFGRAFGYSEEERMKLQEIILDNTKDYDFPILYGVDIGHSDPQITIPLGAEVEIDSEENLFEFL
jgi:muramoyltetrapeptide carboxypeptidase